MAYTLPQFNLACNIGSGAVPAFFIPRISGQSCALVYGKRVSEMTEVTTGTVATLIMHILFPAGTDVRGREVVGGASDLIECPAGTGRWYTVASVDDIGKGWPNEHRTAEVRAFPSSWTPPYP